MEKQLLFVLILACSQKSVRCSYIITKAYLISRTNSLTFPETGNVAQSNMISRVQRANLAIFFLFTLKIAIIPTMFTVNHAKFFEISLEAVFGGNKYVNIADFGLQKSENDRKFVRNSNSNLAHLTFQFSDVRELKTIKIRLCIISCMQSLLCDYYTLDIQELLSVF